MHSKNKEFLDSFEKAAKIRDRHFMKVIHNLSRGISAKTKGVSRKGLKFLKVIRGAK